MRAEGEATCPVCKGSRSTLRYQLSDFRVRNCTDCEVVYLWPRIDEETVRDLFRRLYTGGPQSLPELDGYYEFTFEDRPDNPLVETYEQWLDGVEAHMSPGHLLDIGCGTGLFPAVARRRGWTSVGVDESSEATRHAREAFGIEVWEGPFEEFAARGQRFDLITLWDVIEHSREPVALLSQARKALRGGGLLALSTPNQRSLLDVLAGLVYRASAGHLRAPLEKFYIEQHFLYFSPRTLSDTLHRAGLETVDLRLEATDLRRLSLSPPLRMALRVLFAAARPAGLDNRLFCIARDLAAREGVRT